MDTTVFTIEQVLEEKSKLVDRYQMLYSQYKLLKAEYVKIETRYNREYYKCISEVDTSSTKGRLLKDQFEALITEKMNPELVDAYIKIKYDLDMISLQLDEAKAISKELSDIIVIYGIKRKVESSM